MKTKPNLIMVTVACQLPDGQIIRHDRMVTREQVEMAIYPSDVLGYQALQAFVEMDKQLAALPEPVPA